jgi:hypothetical protein
MAAPQYRGDAPVDTRSPPRVEGGADNEARHIAGGASPKHYKSHAGSADRNPRADRQGVNNPRHGNEPMPDRREQLGPKAR